MPAIQSLGVGSGLDANSIVTQLMAVERRPLTLLQKSASGIQSQISVYGNIKSRLDTLQSAADKIKLATNWSPVKVDNAGSTAVSASVSGSPAAGDITVGVSQLARAQSVATAPRALTDSLGTGTLRIELGQWSPPPSSSFSGTAGASVDVTIDASTGSTLSSVRDAINSAVSAAKAAKLAGTRQEDVPDVAASIVTDSTGSRLVLRSATTGEANGFRLSSVGQPPHSPAFSDLVVNPPGSGLQVTSLAANLQATVNGVPVTLAGNTMTDVVPGVTIQANSVTTTDARIKVTQDVEALKKGISDFISAYNEVIKYTSQQTAYDATTKKGGPLQGDRSALSLLSQLRQAVTSPTGATTAFSGTTGQASRLSDIGITVQRDGTLQSDATKLDKALAQLPELTKLFSQVNTSDTTQQGIAQSVSKLLVSLTGTDGALSARQSGLSASLTRNQNDQTRINDRLAQVEARLRAQYTALDKRMAGLNGLGRYISALGG